MQTLHLSCELDADLDEDGATVPPNARVRTLCAVLGSVQSAHSLHGIKLHVRSALQDDGWSYCVDRSGFLDILCGEAVIDVLSRFSELRQLHLQLDERAKKFNNEWWKSQMLLRLPDHLRSVFPLSVEVNCDTDGTLLWIVCLTVGSL